MFKKSLFILLVFFINGCVGTIKIAEENGVKSKDLTTPTHQSNGVAKLKD